jgi:HSP20 family protein
VAEIYETPQEYVVSLEIAGLTEDEISVNQINNILIVRGTRNFRRASEDAQYHSTERTYGTFERLFPLPNYVESDNFQTSLADGIFEIRLTKTETATGASGARGKGATQAKSGKSSHEAAQEKDKKK